MQFRKSLIDLEKRQQSLDFLSRWDLFRAQATREARERKRAERAQLIVKLWVALIA